MLIEFLRGWAQPSCPPGTGILVCALAAVLSLVVPARSAIALEGFGADTPGGAGGALVRVTSLDDDGPGSLREALAGGTRTIVFDVAGEIVLADHLYVSGPFVTIDGLTAPPPGITLRGRGLIIHGSRGAHDVIVRGLRVRASTVDGIQIAHGAHHVVVDHVSIDGSADGNLDITEDAHDVTVSWSILSRPADPQKNMLIKYRASRISLHHNLFVNAVQRNPAVSIDDDGTPAADTTVDMRNNVVAGWGPGYGTWIRAQARANVVANYYSAKGGDAMGALLVDVATSARAHVADNVSADGLTESVNAAGTDPEPFPAPPVTTLDACVAATAVLTTAGVDPLDRIDEEHARSLPLAPCPGAVTLRADAVAGTDDAVEYASGVVKAREASLRIGRDFTGAFRFANVPIPPQAIIHSASLWVFGHNYPDAHVKLRYAAEATDNSAPVKEVLRNLSSRAVTAASVADAPAAWTRGVYNASADLARPLREIVNRPGWLGRALTIFVDDEGSSRSRVVGSAESGRPAYLLVTYSLP
jgi:hypothetical protein